MRAVQITSFGGPEVLEVQEVPEPQPEPGQLVVAVDVVEVIYLDTQLRAGWGKDFFPMRPPWVPGTGVAGTVRSVGANVDRSRVGTRVVARTGNEGAYAERVALPATEAFDVPNGLDLAVATAALHDAPLALDRLEHAALGPGTRVLVTAAAGSLGHWFVPLAVEAGAHVVGAAGGPTKTAAVAALGADLAVDYRNPRWLDEVTEPFDVVFDGVGGDIGRAALARTVDDGVFFAHGAASGDFATPGAERRVRVVGVEKPLDDATWQRHTRTGLDLLAAGRVRPVIGQRVPLARAADAHAAIARRSVIGKSVLTVEA